MNSELPINLTHLLRQRAVEGERIEHKTSWNIEPASRVRVKPV